MAKIRIRFQYPTRRVLGGELKAADIAGAEWTAKGPADTAFAPIGVAPYPAKDLLTPELAFGTWAFRGVCVLKDGKKSKPVEGSYTIDDTSDPEVLLDLSFVVEA